MQSARIALWFLGWFWGGAVPRNLRLCWWNEQHGDGFSKGEIEGDHDKTWRESTSKMSRVVRKEKKRRVEKQEDSGPYYCAGRVESAL